MHQKAFLLKQQRVKSGIPHVKYSTGEEERIRWSDFPEPTHFWEALKQHNLGLGTGTKVSLSFNTINYYIGFLQFHEWKPNVQNYSTSVVLLFFWTHVTDNILFIYSTLINSIVPVGKGRV